MFEDVNRGSAGNRLSELRKAFPAAARDILTLIWEYHLKENENIPEQNILRLIKNLEDWEWVKAHKPPLLRNLGFSDVVRHSPNLLGALLTKEGRKYEDLLIRYLEYIIGKFRADGNFSKLTEEELRKDWGMTKEEGFLVSQLVFLAGFANPLNSSFGFNIWYAGLPMDIGELLHEGDLRKVLEERALDVFTEYEEEEADAEADIDKGDPESEKNIFLKVDDTFDLRFEGKETRLEYLMGLDLISWLLKNPGKEFFCRELERELSPADSDLSAGDIVSDDLPITFTPGGALPLTDMKTLLEVKKRLGVIGEKIQAAAERQDFEKEEQLEKERADLLKNLSFVAKNGKPKRLLPDLEQPRDRVRKNITKAFEKIRERLPELEIYLRKCIDPGYSVCYRPNKGVLFETD